MWLKEVNIPEMAANEVAREAELGDAALLIRYLMASNIRGMLPFGGILVSITDLSFSVTFNLHGSNENCSPGIISLFCWSLHVEGW